jgi:hypothetical protein
MAGIATTVKQSLALQISLVLAFLMMMLMAGIAFYIVERRAAAMEADHKGKAVLAANLGAQSYSTVLEEAIDNGILEVTDVFDRNYVLIEGYEWGKNPKYHTRYDSVTDKSVLVMQDRFLDDPDFRFVVGVDVNGYLPTHNSKYMQPLTGDPVKDLEGNRAKRIFNDPTGIAAAKNQQDGFIQMYKRDTGETMWDVSSPIFVKGKHWGGFRIGVSINRLDEAIAKERTFLLAVFAVFTLVVMGIIFFMIKRAMKGVEDLTTAADLISMGEGLETAIKSQTIDEIGRLTKSLDRLRVSMKAAMERMGE